MVGIKPMKALLQIGMLLSATVASIGCQDSRVPALEQRVVQLEQRIQQLESERTKSAGDESERRAKLQGCVEEANATYNQLVSRNGTKTRAGGYSVPVAVLSQMESQRRSGIDECRLLYGK